MDHHHAKYFTPRVEVVKEYVYETKGRRKAKEI